MRVYASVYDLAEGSMNSFIKSNLSMGGIYHVGIEIAGVEWSFGYCEKGSGVFAVEPRKCSLGPFHESVALGNVNISADEVIRILHKLRQEWMGPEYNIMNRNCVVFSQEFLGLLGKQLSLPEYVTAMTEMAVAISGPPWKNKLRLSKAEVFGSPEKELMWKEAESLMRDYERDGKFTGSSLSSVLHSVGAVPPPHTAFETQLICAKSLYRVTRGNYDTYMRQAATRHLILSHKYHS